MRKYFVICCFLFVEHECAQNFYSAVDPVLQKALQCRPKNPGMAVSVVKDGQLVMAKGYGLSDIAAGTLVTNKTLFQISSQTKAFTSALLMKLLAKHPNLSINSNVATLIGDEFRFSSSIWTQNASLRDLMSHKLAIPSNNAMRFDETLTRKNLPRRIKTLEPIYSFRTSFVYSNLNYGLITHIAEKLGNDSFENLLQNEIYSPLGMTSSSFVTRDNSGRDTATGYMDGPANSRAPVPTEFSRKYGTLCGSGCVMSNAVDMAKWMNFHLSGGKNEQGVQVMNESDVEMTHAARNHISSSSISRYFTKPKVPVTTSENNYAAGWKNGHYRGYKILRHSGSTYGYVALLTLFPELNLGIFTALTGTDHKFIFRTLLHNYLADVALGIKPWLNQSTICSFPRPWYDSTPTLPHLVIDKSHKAARPLSHYEGTFSNEAYGDLHVTYNATSHLLNLKYGIGTWKLYPGITHDVFYGEAEGILKHLYDMEIIYFQSTSPGSPISAVLMKSFEPKSPPVFKRKLPFLAINTCPDQQFFAIF